MTDPPTLIGPVTTDHAVGATAPLAVGAAAGGLWWLKSAGHLTKLKYLFRRGRH